MDAAGELSSQSPRTGGGVIDLGADAVGGADDDNADTGAVGGAVVFDDEGKGINQGGHGEMRRDGGGGAGEGVEEGVR